MAIGSAKCSHKHVGNYLTPHSKSFLFCSRGHLDMDRLSNFFKVTQAESGRDEVYILSIRILQCQTAKPFFTVIIDILKIITEHFRDMQQREKKKESCLLCKQLPGLSQHPSRLPSLNLSCRVLENTNLLISTTFLTFTLKSPWHYCQVK